MDLRKIAIKIDSSSFSRVALFGLSKKPKSVRREIDVEIKFKNNELEQRIKQATGGGKSVIHDLSLSIIDTGIKHNEILLEGCTYKVDDNDNKFIVSLEFDSKRVMNSGHNKLDLSDDNDWEEFIKDLKSRFDGIIKDGILQLASKRQFDDEVEKAWKWDLNIKK